MKIDVKAALAEAVADPALHAQAFRFTAEAIENLDGAQERKEVHYSDAGSCSLEVWTRIHAELDKPSLQVQISRFDVGKIYGAHLASLFKAGMGKLRPDLDVRVEERVASKYAIGSMDVAVYEPHLEDALFVADFKTNYWAGRESSPPDPELDVITKTKIESPSYVIQTCGYALAKGAPDFAVVVFAPALQKLGGREPIMLKQFPYETADWKDKTEKEYARLGGATKEDPPSCDATGWRRNLCKSRLCPYRKPSKDDIAIA